MAALFRHGAMDDGRPEWAWRKLLQVSLVTLRQLATFPITVRTAR